jgi:hypothetical protein
MSAADTRTSSRANSIARGSRSGTISVTVTLKSSPPSRNVSVRPMTARRVDSNTAWNAAAAPRLAGVIEDAADHIVASASSGRRGRRRRGGRGSVIDPPL